MKETFYETFTMYLPRLNWPKNSLAVLDGKSSGKFTIYANEAGHLKVEKRND